MKQPAKKSPLNTLLGFDFGMKFIGVAVGQMITQTARALTTLKAIKGEPTWEEIDRLIKHWKPDALVVGIPLNMDGSEQPLTFNAKTFAESLRARYDLPLYEVDERLTTVDARNQLFEEGGYKALKKPHIDSRSAQLILQSWISQYNG